MVIAFGQNIDGTLAEYLVCPEDTLAKVPKHLTYAEVRDILSLYS
jgi:NADPH:quinone reductase-like Zn-dependent oxidoreductase